MVAFRIEVEEDQFTEGPVKLGRVTFCAIGKDGEELSRFLVEQRWLGARGWVVCKWSDKDGCVVVGGPVPREQAEGEALGRIYCAASIRSKTASA